MSATAAPPSGPPAAPLIPPDSAPGFDPPEDVPRRRWGWRAVVGCLVVVAASAATTIVFIKGELRTLASDLSVNKALTVSPRSLAPVGFGDPQTILLIGNDQRKHTTTQPVLPHSNEMLLVRIDPNKPWISMMSIPRELEVTLQTANGPVTTRLNAALIYGGMSLLLSTIKQLTGLSINHVVMIDFNHFKTAIDQIGCVYSTVDRRYYHVNTPYSEQYQEINLQPGYQKLCGTQALQFVSYRHGDTSLVRDARDQDFLLDVKKEYGPSLVDIGNIHKFERIFGRTVQVDRGLQTESGVENLLGTLISAESLRVRQVQLHVNLQPTGANPCSCVTATPQQIQASVQSFLGGTDTLPKHSTAAAAHAVHHHRQAAKLPLVPVSSSELEHARASASALPFPLVYPRLEDAGGSVVPPGFRAYHIHASDGRAYPAYVAVFSAGALGQYYDVQGMTWSGAPMFQSPDQTVTVAGRTYSLYYAGQHLMAVAWTQHGAVYWIHNSLTDAVGNAELLAIAEQTVPLGRPGGVAPPVGAPPPSRVSAVGLPPRTGAATNTTLVQSIGSVGGLLTLIVAPLLWVALVRRRRELGELRGRLQSASVLESRLLARAAQVAVVAPARVAAPAWVAAPARAPSAQLPAYTKYTSSRATRPARLRGRPARTRAAGVALVVAAGAAVILVSGVLDHPASTAASRRAASAAADTIPTVPIAVLNATSTTGAARGLAQQLGSRGIRVAAVGNITQSRAPGLWILYESGARTQAARLARLLTRSRPTLAPINSVEQAAAGTGAPVVVVFE